MTSLIHEKNDSFIFRKNLLTIGILLLAVGAAVFLPELLGIHPQKPQHFSETLRVNQQRIARNAQVASNSIEDLMGTTAQTAAIDAKFNTSQADSQAATDNNLATLSPEVVEVGLRARQAIRSITESSNLQPALDSKPVTPEFAVLSWEDVGKPEIQDHLKRVSNDTTQLLSLLSTEDFPRSHFELRSFQNALHPLLTPKKREKGASLTQVLEFLDYRDSMVTAALLQERAPRKTKLAWKAISLEHVLSDSLSQQRKAEINTTFRPQFYLTEAQFRYDWTNKEEKRFLMPIRAMVSGYFNKKDIASIEWYYSDNPNKRVRARIVGKDKSTFIIPRSSDVRYSTLIVVAIAEDGSQYAKAYNFKRHMNRFPLTHVDRWVEHQTPVDVRDPRLEKIFLVTEGVKVNRSNKKQQVAWRADKSAGHTNFATF